MANRMLLGKFAAGDFRLRVSRPGFNVLNDLTRKNIAFDSTFPDTLSIYQVGRAKFVPHVTNRTDYGFPGLGYIPLCFGLYYDSDNNRHYTYWAKDMNVILDHNTLSLWAHPNVFDAAAANHWYFDYIIFRQKIGGE